MKLAPALAIKALFAAVACLVSTASASATIMRCGPHGVIHVGDSRGEVLTACDQPTEAFERVEFRTVRVLAHRPCKKKRHCTRWIERVVTVHIDDWTYDFGKYRFVQYLTFENGQLVRIENGGYSQRD